MTICPKCKQASGDDWSQCKGSCPMPMSPHYKIKGIIDHLITTVGGTPPVDLTKRTTAGGMDPDDPKVRELKPNGQQKDYIILSEDERKRGFVRPVRRKYTHIVCGSLTVMSQAIAETYARKPDFYSGTYCCGCGSHFPLCRPHGRQAAAPVQVR